MKRGLGVEASSDASSNKLQMPIARSTRQGGACQLRTGLAEAGGGIHDLDQLAVSQRLDSPWRRIPQMNDAPSLQQLGAGFSAGGYLKNHPAVENDPAGRNAIGARVRPGHLQNAFGRHAPMNEVQEMLQAGRLWQNGVMHWLSAPTLRVRKSSHLITPGNRSNDLFYVDVKQPRDAYQCLERRICISVFDSAEI